MSREGPCQATGGDCDVSDLLDDSSAVSSLDKRLWWTSFPMARTQDFQTLSALIQPLEGLKGVSKIVIQVL